MSDSPTFPGKVLYPAAELAERVRQLGLDITRDYQGRDLVVLCVLKGSFVFAADLVRAIALPLVVEFLGVQSYGDATSSSGVVRITLDVARPLSGKDVLIVEDIVDTGLTSRFLLDQIGGRGARSVKLCALLHKPSRTAVDVPIDYLGFTVPDVFIVGYGLDAAQEFRNLPDLRALSPARLAPT